MTIARTRAVKLSTVLCVAIALACLRRKQKLTMTTLRRALRDSPIPRVQFHFNPQVLTIG